MVKTTLCCDQAKFPGIVSIVCGWVLAAVSCGQQEMTLSLVAAESTTVHVDSSSWNPRFGGVVGDTPYLVSCGGVGGESGVRVSDVRESALHLLAEYRHPVQVDYCSHPIECWEKRPCILTSGINGQATILYLAPGQHLESKWEGRVTRLASIVFDPLDQALLLIDGHIVTKINENGQTSFKEFNGQVNQAEISNAGPIGIENHELVSIYGAETLAESMFEGRRVIQLAASGDLICSIATTRLRRQELFECWSLDTRSAHKAARALPKGIWRLRGCDSSVLLWEVDTGRLVSVSQDGDLRELEFDHPIDPVFWVWPGCSTKTTYLAHQNGLTIVSVGGASEATGGGSAEVAR